mgnify:CR=1 FL=1
MLNGSVWFKRLVADCKKLSPHLKFVPVKHGFYRIYWKSGVKSAYVHEVYMWMPMKGYDIEEKDLRFSSKQYYEQYEDRAELTLKIKNFVEGYYDSMDTLKKRVLLLRNNKEFLQNAERAYQNVVVK